MIRRKYSRNHYIRFNQFINSPNKNGCIEWNGEIISSGYGRFSVNCKKIVAHRFSWEMNRGKIPCGKLILHKCDNRKCVNIDHLFIGTHKDNAIDRNKKHRNNEPKGEKNHFSKFKEKDVINIRKLSERGLTQRNIASIFNTKQSTIFNIVNRKTWKHI